MFKEPHVVLEPQDADPWRRPYNPKIMFRLSPVQGVTTVRFGTELRYGTVRFWKKVRYGIMYGIFRKSTVRKYGIIFSVPYRTLSVLQ